MYQKNGRSFSNVFCSVDISFLGCLYKNSISFTTTMAGECQRKKERDENYNNTDTPLTKISLALQQRNPHVCIPNGSLLNHPSCPQDDPFSQWTELKPNIKHQSTA